MIRPPISSFYSSHLTERSLIRGASCHELNKNWDRFREGAPLPDNPSEASQWAEDVWRRFGDQGAIRASRAGISVLSTGEQLDPLRGVKTAQKLGQGRNGVVYAASDRSGRDLAVKVTSCPLSKEVMMGVLNEFLLQHFACEQAPCRVVGVSELVITQEAAYLVQERAPKTLNVLFDEGMVRQASEVGEIFVKALDAICEVHSLGIDHNDLKLANIAAEKDGERGWKVKLLDFGGARVEARGDLAPKEAFSLLQQLIQLYEMSYFMRNEEPSVSDQKTISELKGLLRRCPGKEVELGSWIRCFDDFRMHPKGESFPMWA